MKTLRMLPPVLLTTALIALLAASSTAQVGLEFTPPIPRPGEVFGIRATLVTSCIFLRAETEVDGRRFKITAVETCSCFPILSQPFDFDTYAGPLAAGDYTAELWEKHEEGGAPCGEPTLVATREVTVSPAGEPGLISLVPFPLTSEERLRLTLRSVCPAQTSYLPPELDGRVLILVQRYNPGILAPCVSVPLEVGTFEVGPLEAGSYLLRHFTVELPLAGDGELPAEPDFELPFEVTEREPLLLGGHRFAVSARWRDPRSGNSGQGRPLILTADTGSFWFFAPANVEVVVKVLDGCPVNGRFWVFAAGLTDLEVELEVKDLLADLTRRYRNPPRTPFAPILDTTAFAGCDP